MLSVRVVVVVIRCHHRCRRHTFHFHSITFEGMYWFHSNFAELYITIKYRSSSILVIISQIFTKFWPFFDLVFVVCFRSVIFEEIHWFHSNFAELYITVKYRSSSILVIIRQILAELWPFFNLVFIVRYHSITFEGMHWFHSSFAELYITVKYRSNLILVIIRQILAELWPVFDLVFVGVLILVSDQ